MKSKCKLKEILAHKEMTLKELSQKSNMNYTQLSDISTGRRVPKITTAYKISSTLGMTIEEVWAFKEIKKDLR